MDCCLLICLVWQRQEERKRGIPALLEKETETNDGIPIRSDFGCVFCSACGSDESDRTQ